MIESLLDNDVFAGVLGAGALGALAYQARAVLILAWHAFVRRFTCEMSVHSGDPAFLYINEWLARQPAARRARRVHLSTSYEDDKWALSVGEGIHWMLRCRPPMLVVRTFEQNSSISAITKQKLSLRVLGGGQAALRRIVDQAMEINEGDGRTEVQLWLGKLGYWRRIGREQARQLSSIVLPAGQAERILEDARYFFSAQDWYAERGVPWRRGYLFHGLPGTGKSSTVHALAGELGKNIYVVSLNSLPNDSALLEFISNVPIDAILLLEDIDLALSSKGRNGSGEEDEPGISLAGLLNALDGVAAGSGRLLVMTSNHPERLDPALTRPGRVDVQEHFGLLGRAEVDRMVYRFHPGLRLDLPGHLEISPAELQGLLMSAPTGELAEGIRKLS